MLQCVSLLVASCAARQEIRCVYWTQRCLLYWQQRDTGPVWPISVYQLEPHLGIIQSSACYHVPRCPQLHCCTLCGKLFVTSTITYACHCSWSHHINVIVVLFGDGYNLWHSGTIHWVTCPSYWFGEAQNTYHHDMAWYDIHLLHLGVHPVAAVGRRYKSRREAAIYKRINNTQKNTETQNIQKWNKKQT